MTGGRNIFLLITLTVLVAIGTAIQFFRSGREESFVDPTLFKTEGLGKIDSVTLESKKGTIRLGYTQTGWKINGQYAADRQLITVLFATLEQVVPKRPVAAVATDSVNAMLDTAGVSVSLFENRVLKKHFVAGGDAQHKQAWFRLERNTPAYVVTIPGYRVYVSQIFGLDVNGWRDKRIFDFNWRNFKSLSASFTNDPSSDFKIEHNSRFFDIAGAPGDTSKVNSYLDELSLLRADQIISRGESTRYDSLASTRPVVKLEIADIAGRKYELVLFGSIPGDPFVLGMAHEDDLVLFSRDQLKSIFVRRQFFRLPPR